jgi:2-C-methyl-D-erythritol 4-phosphate cytidylyltransferase / 2-C-methyl-D-erythritol 2,4-cyclodiphosphate synthase
VLAVDPGADPTPDPTPDPTGVWAVVVAGGSGTRFGGPKQFARIGSSTVLEHSVAAARAACEGVVLVVPADRVDEIGAGSTAAVVDRVVAGGASRAASVRAGLAAVPEGAAIVCVHDAARPLAPASLFRDVIAAVRAGADAAIPAVPVTDTVKQTRIAADGVSEVDRTLDRSVLVAVQTPQAFAAEVLRAAHDGAVADGTHDAATDDASLVESRGGKVVVVPGVAENRKITEPSDLDDARRSFGPRRTGAVRVGNGFDVHRVDPDPARPLVLGGVRFDEGPGLVGHSDADVVAHAVAEALLGAAGLGDLGSHFPDTDERWKDADSIDLLSHVVELVHEQGWRIGNVDCSVVCEAPKLAPRRAAMQERLSAAVGAPVSVKGRRAEGLGAIGRREGIMCWATAILVGSDEETV